MNSSHFLLLALATALAVVTLVSGTPSGSRVTGSNNLNDSLLPIADGERFEGKLYFINQTETNWTEARDMCIRNGMHLGTITTAEQLEFLKRSWSIDFSGDHWMGGRDSQTPSQFVWQDLGFGPAVPVIDFGGVDVPIQLCLTYWSVTILSRTHAEFCTDKFPALCEVEVEEYLKLKGN